MIAFNLFLSMEPARQAGEKPGVACSVRQLFSSNQVLCCYGVVHQMLWVNLQSVRENEHASKNHNKDLLSFKVSLSVAEDRPCIALESLLPGFQQQKKQIGKCDHNLMQATLSQSRTKEQWVGWPLAKYDNKKL